MARKSASKAKPEESEVPQAPAAPEPESPAPPASADGWIDTGNGYAVTLQEGKIVARNAKGKVLATLPKDLKEHEAVLQLKEAVAWLDAHEAECLLSSEGWMLRSIPVPRALLGAAWRDPAWQAALRYAVVHPPGAPEKAGMLLAIDPARGFGTVTPDADTRWLNCDGVALAHPVLLGDLDDWRVFLGEIGAAQKIGQLFRETYTKAKDLDLTKHAIRDWAGAEFDMLQKALGEARKLGLRVRGGSAICRIVENGATVEARFYLGEGDPMGSSTTGDLIWLDNKQQIIPLSDVGPIAFSEGMRMAAAIHAKRTTQEAEA